MARIVLVALVLLAYGKASRYDPGVFERVLEVRQRYGSLPDPLPPYDGAHVALLEGEDVGRVVLVCRGSDCRFALVVDCAGIADGGYAWMVNGGWAAELDHRTYANLGASGERITVWAVDGLAGIVPGRGLGKLVVGR